MDTHAMAGAQEEYDLKANWQVIMGERLSGVVEVLSFSEGTLYVKAQNPVWRMDLQFQRKSLLTRINGYLKRDLVKNIIIK